MKLVVLTYGTEGDTRPLAALCRTLMDAGHETILMADGGTFSTARNLGVPHEAIAGDIRTSLKNDINMSSVVAGKKSSMNATARALSHIANENATAWILQVLDTAAGCDGLIVAGLSAYIGFSAAENLGVPVIGAGMIPLTPTSAFPSPFLSPRSIPRWLNRLTYSAVDHLLWNAFRDATNVARKRVGLAIGHDFWSGNPVLYGISPTLLPKPKDWPENTWMCGQWAHPQYDWQAPKELGDFLAAGEPPIYVGFGSMTGFDQRALLDVIVKAIGGRRALFYPGWSTCIWAEPQELKLPSNFHIMGNAPHDWLFPRTALVIHHGGSGTTHSAACAGVPSVVLPFVADQFFWAEQLYLRGIAPRAANGTKVTATVLARAIDAALKTDMRERAAAIGAKMQNEDGLAIAAEKIQAILAHRISIGASPVEKLL